MVIPLPPRSPAEAASRTRGTSGIDRLERRATRGPRHESQATYPGAFGRATRERSPIWPCSLRGLPSHPGHPECWWALTPPFHPYREGRLSPPARRSVFCGTVLPVAGTGCYPAQCPVEFGLSSPRTFVRAATIRITPAEIDLSKAVDRGATTRATIRLPATFGGRMPGDITLDKEIPHSVEAERSVLGAILIENTAINRAQEILREEDFYREPHRKIFKVMTDLSEKTTAIDPVTVKDELSRSGDLEAVGGPAYIASLVDGVPRSANVEYYARIVKEKAILRSLIEAGGRIVSTAYEASQDADDILDQSERMIFQIAQDRLREGFVPMRAIADQSLKAIERLAERRELITGLPTGYRLLDEYTSGLQSADLIVLAARPGMGKTSFALNIAQYAGVHGKRKVGIFSLEMTREQLFLRMLTGLARVDSHRLRTGRLTKDEWKQLTKAFGELAAAHAFIDDTAGISILEMRAKSRRLKLEHGLDLVVIDYMQLIRSRSRFENRQQEMAEISRSLKELAKELNVPVIAISQLSRAPEQRGEKGRPQLSDLRESGAIEQDADVVLLLYREEMYKPTEENRGIAKGIIAKQRNGPTAEFDMVFSREYTRFEELERQPG